MSRAMSTTDFGQDLLEVIHSIAVIYSALLPCSPSMVAGLLNAGTGQGVVICYAPSQAHYSLSRAGRLVPLHHNWTSPFDLALSFH